VPPFIICTTQLATLGSPRPLLPTLAPHTEPVALIVMLIDMRPASIAF